jgi:hypothetical protein
MEGGRVLKEREIRRYNESEREEIKEIEEQRR